MFDVSFWELLIIGVIALVVVGPERLPGLMRTVGLWVGKARASFQSIRDEVEREVHAEGLRDTKRALEKEARETERQVKDAVDTGEAAGGRAQVRARAPGEGEPARAAGTAPAEAAEGRGAAAGGGAGAEADGGSAAARDDSGRG